ncbi:MAG: sulfate/molybdate ABC transporter ATP-binding protein [Phenylobacterium sp.]|uniref:sulfate/molybdate ABC transporter ATP-binding protein n=1 Tax=Phenylobacterium sp. TaxID=1871053 RepID=UPI00271F71F2|nr:sulfate/molybdate ABC transporter ATP-binding protein [Phenylobacterium sp.]MDO8901505.1 sulfate/molybdate ABC transporter ATP-binding protein [Phenylobacterium sp.]
MSLSIENVAKRFGDHAALDGVSLEARQGEFLALLGPSGSGKTTLLRVLAGLERPDQGMVRFGGEDLLTMDARARRIGMVFQHYALFRHMSVAQNIAFGLQVRPAKTRPSRAEISDRVEGLLSLVQLEGLGGRYPAQLSGGQRQRVALARALAIEPRMLLLDEPFGALDAKVRRDLRGWLRRIHDETGLTTIFVTHDQEEAMDLADRVAILRDGRLEQVDTPEQIYEAPASAFVFDFVGDGVQAPGEVAGGVLTVEGWRTPAPVGALPGPVTMSFRGENTDMLPPHAEGVPARVISVLRRGGLSRATCEIGGRTLVLEAPQSLAAPGIEVRLAPRSYLLHPR